MADDKFTDPRDESTPENSKGTENFKGTGNSEGGPDDPGGADLASPRLPQPDAKSHVSGEPAELTDSEEIDDPAAKPGDGYADDPDTADVNEAKLERATDAVAEEEPESGVAARKRNRANKPVRRVAPQDSFVAGSETPEREGTTKTVARKSEATRKRRDAEKSRRGKSERTGPVKFVNEAVGELRKVVWPTGNQVQQYFVVVLVFVIFIIAFVSLLDLAFGWAILKVFG